MVSTLAPGIRMFSGEELNENINAAASGGGAVNTVSNVSSTVPAMNVAAGLDGSELYYAVQNGEDVCVTGNDIGQLILTNAYSASPMDAATDSGDPGNDIGMNAGAGDGVGAGGSFYATGGAGGSTGAGGLIALTGGPGGAGEDGGSVFLAVGVPGEGGSNGLLYVTDGTYDHAGLPTTDPATPFTLWQNNGLVAVSGCPTYGYTQVLVGSAVSLTTATGANVATLTVNPGDVPSKEGWYWVSGVVYFHPASATAITSLSASIGTTSGVEVTGAGSFGTLYMGGATGTEIGQDVSVIISGAAIHVTEDIFYLVAVGNFSGGALSAYGIVTATPMY